MKNSRIHLMLLGSTLMVAALGCNNEHEPSHYVHGEEYNAQTAPRNEPQFFDREIANGTRLDGTLHPVHFCGDKLNSLGTAKLDYMLAAGDACQPLTVYLNTGKDDKQLADRREAVTAYLESRGVPSTQVAIVDGPNLNYGYPAATSVKALDAFDANAGQFTASDIAGGGASSSSPSGH